MIIIGIDPGLSGAVAVIDEAVTVHPTPIIEVTKRGRRKRKDGTYGRRIERVYDLPAMFAILAELKGARVFLELAKPRPKEGVVSAFKSGGGWLVWKGFCAALGYPLEIIPPEVWEATMLRGVGGKGKGRSILAARQLFPQVSLLRTDKCRTPDDNFADALLIAEYGRRKLGGAL